jgi:hypothetical protein
VRGIQQDSSLLQQTKIVFGMVFEMVFETILEKWKILEAKVHQIEEE